MTTADDDNDTHHPSPNDNDATAADRHRHLRLTTAARQWPPSLWHDADGDGYPRCNDA